VELSLEQRRAIALAQARRRSQEPTSLASIFPRVAVWKMIIAGLILDAGVTGFLRARIGRRAQGIMQWRNCR
jgi:hypothetical protein